MASPFNMPDEFLQGLAKSGATFWQALIPGLQAFTPAIHAESGSATEPSAQAPASWPGTSMVRLQMDYLRRYAELWGGVMSGSGTEAGLEPVRGDRRFSAAEWREQPGYSLLKQSYLLNAQLVIDMVDAVELKPAEKQKLRFYANQFIDAMSPTNFLATNPDAVRLAIESQGESLRAGFGNLLADLRKGGLSITDESAFEVGRNVAASEGAVVFENELFQLIQYAPLTDQVASRPLLIVPPCINKFYILDLQPANSFVRYAAEQGQTVFVMSWRNPDESCAHLTWDDYVEVGVIAAIEVALEITGADKINALGWCVGGTLLSSALAVLGAQGDAPVSSLTLLTTMLDFSEPGDLGIFIDEANVRQREQTIGQGGLYRGAELGFVFQTLRANDLIWPNVINNYLKGKSPEAFDLLYWNADATNLPGPMYAWYLRNAYLENNLCVPGRLTMCGEPVDLGVIDMPSYVFAAQEDHIVPWRSAYRTTQLLGGKSQFVLGASGHIAGVINPASKNRRSYWTGGAQGEDPQAWFTSAQENPGSWWSHWLKWLKPKAGKTIAAPSTAGSSAYPVIEPAPGSYVKIRAD